MTSHGRLPEFSGSAAEWDVFAKQLKFYFTANGISDAAKQRAILLSSCGTVTYKLLKTLVAPAELTSKSFAELVLLAQEHYDQKPSVIMRRFRFKTCVRQEGESITAYVTRLRDLASHCEYGDSAKELIRDHLVCGVRDDTLQRSLLSAAKLTFDKAYELALLHESAVQNARVLSGLSSSTASMNFADTSPRPTREAPQGKLSCYRCGGNHQAKSCRFKDTVCNFCNKRGHLQRVCRSRQGQTPARKEQTPLARTKSKNQETRAHKMEEEQPLGSSASSSGTDTPAKPRDQPAELLPVNYEIFAMGTDEKIEPYLVFVDVNGTTLQMEIDTGSALTLISQETFSKLWPQGGAPQLEKTSFRLKTYSGEELKVIGRAAVRVGCGRQVVEDLGLVVVGGKGPSLLGRDWLGKLRLDWGAIRTIQSVDATLSTLEAVLARHANLFRNKLGTIKGATAKLHVSPDAKSRFYRPRSIPHALRSRVDQALDKLMSDGILEAVQFSEWAASVVLVVKRDGSIRLCGDYKLTVNQVALVDTCPLPLVQDIFASLSNGKSFTKLDLAHAYQQLELDIDSRPYTTINTHQGLFRYTRLPFGVAAAPAIFQRTMESLLGDLSHVCVYLDDILVAGESETAHLQNLSRLLEPLESAGVQLKQEKCSFMLPEVEYLGHSISAQGIRSLREKVRAIRDAPRPQDISQIRSFLGMLNYYGKFLPNLATLLRPLYDLLQSAETWNWEEPQDRAFREAQTLLSSAPLLTHYDHKKPLVLSCDASPYGVGAVLSHRMDDKSDRPIAYASRTLSAAE